MTLKARLGRRQSNARLPEHLYILDVCWFIFAAVASALVNAFTHKLRIIKPHKMTR